MITTGGGFSGYYPRPSYQQAAVNAYFSSLDNSNQPAPGYNIQGRGYPDISTLGVAHEVIIGGQISLLFGTSCSAPVMAALGNVIT